jgi:Rho-type GTPase-activating protein 1/2
MSDREVANLSRSLSIRLDNVKAQYRGELVSLADERETLIREIAELRSARDVFLEETTMLNARNEELAQLNAHYMRRIEAASPEAREKPSLDSQHSVVNSQPSNPVNGLLASSTDESVDSSRSAKAPKPSSSDAAALRVFKWRGNNKEASAATSPALDGANERNIYKHTFQQVSVLRFTRCDHCGEKLWGSQFRCQSTDADHLFSVSCLKPCLFSSLQYLRTSPLSTTRAGHLLTPELSPRGRACTGHFAFVYFPAWAIRI